MSDHPWIIHSHSEIFLLFFGITGLGRSPNCDLSIWDLDDPDNISICFSFYKSCFFPFSEICVRNWKMMALVSDNFMMALVSDHHIRKPRSPLTAAYNFAMSVISRRIVKNVPLILKGHYWGQKCQRRRK